MWSSSVRTGPIQKDEIPDHVGPPDFFSRVAKDGYTIIRCDLCSKDLSEDHCRGKQRLRNF
eukprot:2552261-Lingulodinium_polyedra.AAC.1